MDYVMDRVNTKLDKEYAKHSLEFNSTPKHNIKTLQNIWDKRKNEIMDDEFEIAKRQYNLDHGLVVPDNTNSTAKGGKSKHRRKTRKSKKSRKHNSITAHGITSIFRRKRPAPTTRSPRPRTQRHPTPFEIANILFPILHKISIAHDAIGQNTSAANDIDNNLYEYSNDSQNINRNIKTQFRNNPMGTERSYMDMLSHLESQIQTSHDQQYKYDQLQGIYNKLGQLKIYDTFAIYRALTNNGFTTWNIIENTPGLEDQIITCNTRNKKTQLIRDIGETYSAQSDEEEYSVKNCLKLCMEHK